MMSRRPRVAAVLALAGSLAAPALAAAQKEGSQPMTVYAASSLTKAFTKLDGGERYSFASSGTLEEQIRQGAPADLFASASAENAQRLFREGLVARPVAFASNRLALIVPRANPGGIRSLTDLDKPGVRLVIAAASVPVGGYARTALRRLGLASALAQVVSEEPDAKAVAAKVALGEADAGIVYRTDARAVADRVRMIAIPASAQPTVRYEIAVVTSSPNKARAKAWVATLLSAKGQAVLMAAGFLPAPSR